MNTLGPAVSLDLVVLRSADPERARAFYAALGLSFVEEQHGSGPPHLAATLANGVVVEIYPLGDTGAGAGTGGLSAGRLGFVVPDVGVAVAAVVAAGGTVVRSSGDRATLTDPDGNAVDLRS